MIAFTNTQKQEQEHLPPELAGCHHDITSILALFLYHEYSRHGLPPTEKGSDPPNGSCSPSPR